MRTLVFPVLLTLTLGGPARAQDTQAAPEFLPATLPETLPRVLPETGPGALPGEIDLRLPLPEACISSPFGHRRAAGPAAATFHNGIDLPAPAGTWVTAAAAGHVVAVRYLGSFGLEVEIEHGPPDHPFITRYAHLGSIAPGIASGTSWTFAGDRIGRVGSTGITYGTHLHFEVRIGGIPIDPAPYLNTKNCRL